MSLDGPQVGINECLYELSKDLEGRTHSWTSNDEKCERLNCTSFKTTHKLEAEFHLTHNAIQKKEKYLMED